MSAQETPTQQQLAETEAEKRAKMPYWQQAIMSGRDQGRADFYDDPDMQMLRGKRLSLADGYSGNELSAIRGAAARELQGTRQGYMNSLRSNLGRQGVGGARAAAMVGSANQKALGSQGDMERKMAADSAQMKRQGTSDLQDFLFRQKYGTLATGLGYGQLASAENTAAAMRRAAGGGGGGLFGDMNDETKSGLGFLVGGIPGALAGLF